MLGWIASLFTVIGLIEVGNKNILGCLLLAFGSILWVWYGLSLGLPEIYTVNIVFFIINLINWKKWGYSP